MLKKSLFVLSFVAGLGVAGVSASADRVVEDETSFTCTEHVQCIAEGGCGGVSWERVGNCGMQCKVAGTGPGEIKDGVFVQCTPEM
jgi:hypothetical protein